VPLSSYDFSPELKGKSKRGGTKETGKEREGGELEILNDLSMLGWISSAAFSCNMDTQEIGDQTGGRSKDV